MEYGEYGFESIAEEAARRLEEERLQVEHRGLTDVAQQDMAQFNADYERRVFAETVVNAKAVRWALRGAGIRPDETLRINPLVAHRGWDLGGVTREINAQRDGITTTVDWPALLDRWGHVRFENGRLRRANSSLPILRQVNVGLEKLNQRHDLGL